MRAAAACVLLVGVCADEAKLPLPPGPVELPFIGSAQFMIAKKWQKIATPQLLTEYREQYGELFTFKTGPMRHVWASGAVADELLAHPKAQWRWKMWWDGPPPFGDDFLFHVMDPKQAVQVRPRQHAWLQENAGPTQIAAAMMEIEEDIVEALLWQKDDPKMDGVWPREIMSKELLKPILKVFLGVQDGNLNDSERANLLRALNGYRKQPNHVKGNSGPSGLFKGDVPLENYAKQVRDLIDVALTRSGRDADNERPLLVAAAVGGAELFPLIFEWIVRRIAVEHERQGELREEVMAAGSALFGPKIAAAVSESMRQSAYSAGIGPPRMVVGDINLQPRDGLPQGARVPNGTLLFAMQPGLLVGKGPRETGQWPPLQYNQREWSDETKADHARIFGGGERDCLSKVFALNFLNAALAIVLRNFEVIPPRQLDEETIRLTAFKADGAHLLPLNEVPLFYKRIPREHSAAEEARLKPKAFQELDMSDTGSEAVKAVTILRGPDWTEAPGGAAPECATEDGRRRLQGMMMHGVDGPTDPEHRWRAEWMQRLGCWWVALPGPTRMDLGPCMGALGLHIASRFDAALRTSGVRTGPPAESLPAQEAGCEWVPAATKRLQLPELPSLTEFDWGGYEWTLPPIPRLLPTQQLLSLAPLPTDGTALASASKGDAGTKEAKKPSASRPMPVSTSGLGQSRDHDYPLARPQESHASDTSDLTSYTMVGAAAGFGGALLAVAAAAGVWGCGSRQRALGGAQPTLPVRTSSSSSTISK